MAQHYTGFLIAVEGIDGSGKSTFASELYTYLHKNYTTLLTKEPGGTQLGTTLRELLQNQRIPLSKKTEFLLFAADRAQHFAQIIIPALKSGTIIISDRMNDSSVAYQGFGRGLDIQMITKINSWVMENITPDLILHVKVPLEIAQQRIMNRKELTTFEKEKQSFMYRVAQGFETLYKNKNNVITVDGTQPLEKIIDHTAQKIEQWLKKTQHSLAR